MMNKRSLVIVFALLLMGFAGMAQAGENDARMPWYWFSHHSGDAWTGSYLSEHNGGEGAWNHDLQLVKWGKVRFYDPRNQFCEIRNVYKTYTVSLMEDRDWSDWQVKRLYAYYVSSVLNAANDRGGRIPKWAIRHAYSEINKELQGLPVNMDRVERCRLILRKYCGFNENNKAMASEPASMDQIKAMYR